MAVRLHGIYVNSLIVDNEASDEYQQISYNLRPNSFQLYFIRLTWDFQCHFHGQNFMKTNKFKPLNSSLHFTFQMDDFIMQIIRHHEALAQESLNLGKIDLISTWYY